jgi:uncharacterized OB-fold protein
MIEHRMLLDYRLHAGWLTPWIEGLAKGRALGWHCQNCGRTSFPPERVCRCGARGGEWSELSGSAALISRTEGPDGVFGLVRLEGADTLTVARLAGDAPQHGELKLLPSGGTLPAVVIG